MEVTLQDALRTAAFWNQRWCLQCNEVVEDGDEGHDEEVVVPATSLLRAFDAFIADDEG